VERFVAEAKRKGQNFCTPKIGEIVTLGDEPKENNWYNDIE